MNRRGFLKAGAGTAGAAVSAAGLKAAVPEHNWEKYDWGAGPEVKDRLYQGPFPQYPPGRGGSRQRRRHGHHAFDGDRSELRHGSRRLCFRRHRDRREFRARRSKSRSKIWSRSPSLRKIYIRPNWREVQKQPGRLDFPDWWQITFELARQYNKRVGFRIMLENPDFPEPGMPEFLMEKVPYVKLKGEWKGNPLETRYRKEHRDAALRSPGLSGCVSEN